MSGQIFAPAKSSKAQNLNFCLIAYKEVTAEYNDRIDALKESLSEQYAEEKQQALDDYPIFMAIAEDIGYDATGKPTNNNELDFISEELARFIDAIERGKV